MDTYEAAEIVISRIKNLDPENATRIVGYTLIQDQGDKELIRLAFGPETLLLTYINQVKLRLGLLSNTCSSNPSTPISNPIAVNNNNPFSRGASSPRILIPNNGLPHLGSNPSSPAGVFARNSPRPIPSYEAVMNGSEFGGNTRSGGSSMLQFRGGDNFGDGFFNNGGFGMHGHSEFRDDSMVSPVISSSRRSDSLVYPYGEDVNGIPLAHPQNPFHRRSYSVNDSAFLSNLEDVGGGRRPLCTYFARGICKNGSNCKFSHGEIGNRAGIEVGSPSNGLSGSDELMRMKALHQQRLALMASGGCRSFSHSNHFLNENSRTSAAALMMGSEFDDFDLRRPDRNEYGYMGLGCGSSLSARQIYMTFPAESTFTEEDISSYFSMFGPVEDVRIPDHQERNYGFVTFTYPETVKLILAKKNPHLVRDSRVLVKPYKEKGKVYDKKHQQELIESLERANYPASISPRGLDIREHLNLPFGPRMLANTQEMKLKRQLEQEVELRHAIELESRRMMNLQLMDPRDQRNAHHFLPNTQPGVSIRSPRQSQFLMSQNGTAASDTNNHEVSEGYLVGFNGIKETSRSSDVVANNGNWAEGPEISCYNKTDNGNGKQPVNAEEFDLPKSLEKMLPDMLSASPTKSAAEYQSSTGDVSYATKMFSSSTVLSSSSPK